MMATVADEHLIAQVASGDPDAVGGLYDRYATVLLPVALRILGSRADAEDVVHDAFVTLPERSRHYSVERGSVAAWLIILVRNLSLDRIRRRGVRAAFVRESPQALQPQAANDPEIAADAARHAERVRRALESLPLVQQVTLRTAFLRGSQLLRDCRSGGALSRDRQVTRGTCACLATRSARGRGHSSFLPLNFRRDGRWRASSSAGRAPSERTTGEAVTWRAIRA
jgi:RNA polymerase sigma-70 factor (ECF subfamily)